MIAFVYLISLYAYRTGIGIASNFNSKAKAWITGRKQWRQNLPKQLSALDSQPIWFHCASYGEYLQAFPLIQSLYNSFSTPIVLSFFSPSGYNNFKPCNEIQCAFYLPLDTKANAKKMVEIIKPKMFVGVKYDIWPNLQTVLKKNQIPQILLAAQFRENQIYFKPWGRFFKNALQSFHPIFTQYPSSKTLLDKHNINNTLVGDPRFDQALSNVATPFKNEFLDFFLGNKKAIIFGSAWADEIIVAAELANIFPEEKIIIAPHEVNPKHLTEVLKTLNGNYDLLSSGKTNTNVLVIDSVGILRYIYRYGKLAQVAGGFKGKLHNIIEPLAYGIPIIIGHHHYRFPEAQFSIDSRAAIECSSKQEMVRSMAQLIQSPQELNNKSERARALAIEKSGATKSVSNHPIFAHHLTPKK